MRLSEFAVPALSAVTTKYGRAWDNAISLVETAVMTLLALAMSRAILKVGCLASDD